MTAAVFECLRDGERFVTLAGPSGVGKTRLALAVAHDERVSAQAHQRHSPVPDAADDHSIHPSEPLFHGAAWVDLGEDVTADSPNGAIRHIEEAVIAALGIGRDGDTNLMSVLNDVIQDERLLLILDNCEHVHDAAAAVISNLLSYVPSLSVLATTQHKFNIRGERLVDVPSLGCRAGDDDPDEAVHMLIQAARRRDYHFEPEPAMPTIRQLASEVDGMPLALQLIGAELPATTPQTLLEDLRKEGLFILENGDPFSHNHESIAASMAVSWARVKDHEQQAWSALSVFRGGFREDAAAAVLADLQPEHPAPAGTRRRVDHTLRSMMDKSIIDRGHIDVNGRRRFRLLASIQAKGAVELRAAGQEDLTRARHLRFYADLAARARTEWFTTRDATWEWRLSSELSNIEAALHYAAESDPLVGLRMLSDLTAMRAFHFDAILWTGVEWFDMLLAALPDWNTHPDVVSDSLAWQGWLHVCLGNQEHARRCLDRATELAAHTTTPRGAVTFLVGSFATFGRPIDDTSSQQSDHAVATLQHAAELFTAHHDQGAAHLAHLFAALHGIFFYTADHAQPLVDALKTQEAAFDSPDTPWITGWSGFCEAVLLLKRAQQTRIDGDRHAATALCVRAKELIDATQRGWVEARDRWSPTWGLAAQSWCLAELGRYWRAAVVAGASQQAQARSNENILGLPGFRQFEEAARAACRDSLGDEGYNKAFARGRQDSFEAVLDMAVQPPGGSDADQLSPREWDVLRVIAEHPNVTMAGIGEILIIGKRTAETHYNNIRTKLGVKTRDELLTLIRDWPELQSAEHADETTDPRP